MHIQSARTQPAVAAEPMALLSHFRPGISLIVLFTLLTGVAFPLAFVGLGHMVLPFQSGGSLIVQDGKIVGSSLIGQAFTSARYFHGRPSALMGADPKDASKQVPTPYDASESGASNLSATSKALLDRVTGEVKTLGAANTVPADAVTTSASGLDPDISPANAGLQIARVAAARKMNPADVATLVAAHTDRQLFGFIGESRVNVLALNLALDAGLDHHTQ
jgi:K+-transporting ATPase ATPase C chain